MTKWAKMDIKTELEIKKMEKAGELLATILTEVCSHCVPGISTKKLDEIAENLVLDNRALPTFKGYQGYPATICSSVNDVIIHGIPTSTKLKSGDILSIDMGLTLDGWIADSALTIPIGKVSAEAMKLIDVTQTSLYRGLELAKPGFRLFDISRAIQNYVENNGYSVVRDFVGHGVGRNLHEDPSIPNFLPPLTSVYRNIKLKPGMTLAIEPMVNQGTHNVKIMKDRWTVRTKDNKLSAHFEHSIAICKDKTIILTHRKDDKIDREL